MHARVAALQDWEGETKKERLLGEGKYGKVYSTRNCVVKETQTKHEHLRRQALREHAIGVLQSLLVLQGSTPHLPLHYGTCLGRRDACLAGRLFMERFDGALSDLGYVLSTEAHWMAIAFQLLFTVAALAESLGISHNDAYPRNVLVTRMAEPYRATYELGGRGFQLKWSFAVALTDFGIASSNRLMGPRKMPEVSDSLKLQPTTSSFGLERPDRHILKQKDLPVFSRDSYTILKWIFFKTKNLPEPPSAVRAWAKASLQLLDECRSELHSATGLTAFVQKVFERRWLKRCQLAALARRDSSPADFVAPLPAKAQEKLLRDAAQVLVNIPSAFRESESSSDSLENGTVATGA